MPCPPASRIAIRIRVLRDELRAYGVPRSPACFSICCCGTNHRERQRAGMRVLHRDGSPPHTPLRHARERGSTCGPDDRSLSLAALCWGSGCDAGPRSTESSMPLQQPRSDREAETEAHVLAEPLWIIGAPGVI